MAAEIIFREAAGKFCYVASDEPLLMFITGKKKSDMIKCMFS